VFDIAGIRTYERFDLRLDLRVEARFEPPFLAASVEAACGKSSWASAQRSHASQYASSRSRNACPACTWRRASSALSAATQRDCVRPAIPRVML
jgi:hypothetical protein